MDNRKITPKQKKLLDYIRDFAQSMGYAPSQAEIAAHFGFRSLGTIQNYLKILEREGHLKREWNAKRALIPVAARASVHTLPLLGMVAAGKPIEAIENRDEIEVPPTMLGRGDNFVLKVKGDSMVGDGIMNGDYVVVAKRSTAENGATVVALVDGEATVKRYHKKGEHIELRSANPFVPDIHVDAGSDFAIEGIVVGVIRHL